MAARPSIGRSVLSDTASQTPNPNAEAGVGRAGPSLAGTAVGHHVTAMWNQPYLETCCRSALHRLFLAGPLGRPSALACDGAATALKDAACLDRLAGMDLVHSTPDGRFHLSAAGRDMHTLLLARRGRQA